MKIIFSEFLANYKNYSFGYCVYCIYERSKDKLSDIYAKGFLPYSGSRDLLQYFYLARSLRVGLSDFSFTSENRRVHKKYENQFEKVYLCKANEELKKFYLEYFKKVHGEKIMSKERLDFIFDFNIINEIVIYKKENKMIGSILLVNDGGDNKNKMSHFWYSAYAPEYAQTSFGMFMMLDEASSKKQQGYKYYYIGTGYGEKAKYKMNFDTLEFFDGNIWIQDKKLFKKLIAEDKTREIDDIKKESTMF